MAKKSSKKNLDKKIKLSILLKPRFINSFLVILLLFLTILTYQIIVSDKFYPLTFAGDINISFLTTGQAVRKLESTFNKRAEQKLNLNYSENSFTIDLATSSASIDYSIIEQTFNESKEGNLLDAFRKQLLTLFVTNKISPKIELSLDKQFEALERNINKDPQNAQLIFDEVGKEATSSIHIQTKPGNDGLSLDRQLTEQIIIDYLLTGKHLRQIPVKAVAPKVSTNDVEKMKQILEEVNNQPIKLSFDQNSYTLDAKQLLALLDLQKGEGLLDKDKTNTYLGKIAAEIDQPVQEGLFEFNSQTKRVTAFRSSQEGRKLNLDKTSQLLTDALSNNAKNILLPVEVVAPKIQTSDVNSLGIRELLGSGVSHFAGSIPNRIYNVNLTAQKINGVLIPPGEVFSFNQTVGDISAATGFKQAYVIKEGRTVLDDGGGVCQDSTTLFRAVLNAGLPVIKRTAHAYRVGYYEQGSPPGIDATVFYPSVDFQFKNDTPSHILVQAYTSGTTLYVDLYGTSDGRVVTLTKPIVTNQTPAPAELRQDDPTLPKGTVKQVDWAAAGATVTFGRTVVKNGETLAKETWRSNYKAWQAVYLVGTQ